jgi:tetratricopeptide (TPR) repeat protein
MYERACDLSEAAVTANPMFARYRRYLRLHYKNIREELWKDGMPAEAFESGLKELAFWKKLTAANPDVVDLGHELAEKHALIGVLLVQMGRNPEALDFFAKALAAMQSDGGLRSVSEKLSDRDTQIASFRASLYLLTGDRPQYARHCAQLLERSGAGDSTGNTFKLAWACAHGDGVVDTSAVIRLAEQAVARSPAAAWCRNALACALLRAGRYEDALRSLGEADRLGRDWTAAPVNDLVRAIVLQHQGRSAAARGAYDRAVRRAERQGEKAWYGLRPNDVPLSDALIFEVLRCEAEELILDATWPAEPFAAAR